MSRIENFLHRVVKDENSATEFFCNLLKIHVFREKFLETFLPLSVARSIRFEDIDTQSPVGGSQPDMRIESGDVCILVEVKIEGLRALTPNQPERYLEYISQEDIKAKYKVLVFVLPQGYIHERELIDRLERYSKIHSIVPKIAKGSYTLENVVQWCVIYWEDIIHLISENGLERFNPFIDEFFKLLQNWYLSSPIIFNKSEVKMMFSKIIPEAIKTLNKLKGIVDSIEQKNKKFNAKGYRSEKDGEYGIYFYNTRGESILWFGIWYECWEKMEVPLIFGVGAEETYQARKIFIEHLPSNRRKRWEEKNFDFGWFDQIVLLEGNAVEFIWKELEPLLEKMTTELEEGNRGRT